LPGDEDPIEGGERDDKKMEKPVVQQLNKQFPG
jgi:hypothetical protein